MTRRPVLVLAALPAAVLAAVPARAHVPRFEAPGALVSVSVEVDGRSAPLYAARDGSGRHYLEARAGAPYSLRVANRTGGRVGVLLAVDGLNVISGQREAGPDALPAARPGRMYVLGPWDDVVVRGWRTSLSEVRRFTFVDERVSYAARSGRANPKMGWIEAWVFREEGKDVEAPAVAAPKAEGAPETAGRGADAARSVPRAYPGTGWGDRTRDEATEVSFEPEPRPADRVVLRYEYAPALRALGVLPQEPARDRLRERDRGVGFAPPPLW